MRVTSNNTKLVLGSGEVADARTVWLSQPTADQIPFEQFVTYNCRNAGHVAVAFDRDLVTVTLRPSIASDVSMASLGYCLADGQRQFGSVPRYRLNWFDRDWQQAIAPGIPQLIDTIAQYRSDSPEQNNYLQRQATEQELAASTRLDHVLEIWRSGQLNVQQIAEANLDLRPYCDRFLILRKRQMGELVLEGYGEGYSVFESSSVRELRGKPFVCERNLPYLTRAAQGYYYAAHANTPMIEQIDALLKRNSDNIERLTYWRVAITQHLPDGDVLLLSMSADDHSIDLRADAA